MTIQIIYSGPPLVDHAPNRRSGAHGSASYGCTTGQVTAASSSTCKNPTTPVVWPPESNSMDWGVSKSCLYERTSADKLGEWHQLDSGNI